jgi:hypothetical protein
MDNADLGITIALAFFVLEGLGDGIVQRGGGADAFGAAKGGLNGPFALIDGVEA